MKSSDLSAEILKLKSLAKEQKVTYEQLSVSAGIPIGTIKNIFSGATKNPRLDTVKAIEQALGLSQVCPTFPLLGKVVAGIPKDNMSIGERIKIERTRCKLSQATLGAMLNVSQQAVGKWEKGMSEPDSDTIIALSKIFSVSTDFLLGQETSSSQLLNREFPTMGRADLNERIELIKSLAKKKDITYDQIASLSNIPISTIKKIFCGITRTPRIDTVQAIEHALNINSCHELSENEIQLLNLFSCLSKPAQIHLLAFMNDLVAECESCEVSKPNDKKDDFNFEHLNDLRKSLNLSIDELAEKANLPKGTVEKVLFGIVKNPRINTAQKIMNAIYQYQKETKE